MAEDKWFDVGSAEELRARPVSGAGTTPIALVHRDGVFTAISGACNHVGGPLGEGRLDGDYVVCPWHQWRFHHRTGEGEPGFEEDRVAGQMLGFFVELGFLFPQFPYVAHSRGWAAEDMERCVARSARLLASEPASERVARGGRKAHALAAPR